MAETGVARHIPRWRTAFEVVSTVVLIILAAAVVWEGRTRFFGSPSGPTSQARVPIPTEPIPIGKSAIRGVVSAPVAIIEYADFECGSCAHFAGIVAPGLLRDYVDKGRLLMVFKNYPLESHLGARNAARAAWCAGQQGKFWDLHDRLYRIRGGMEDADIKAAANAVGLDMTLYNNCRTTADADKQVQMDKDEGERLKVPGTPTFFVGKVIPNNRVQVTDVVVGSNSVEELKRILDRFFGK